METESTQSNSPESEKRLQWFLYESLEEKGPFTWQEILMDLEAGEITHRSWVWSPGMHDWCTLDQVLIQNQQNSVQKKLPVTPPPLALRPLESLNKVKHLIPTPPQTEKKSIPKPNSIQSKKVLFVGLILVLGLTTIFINRRSTLPASLARELPSSELIRANRFFDRSPSIEALQPWVTITVGHALTPDFYAFVPLKNGTLIDVTLKGKPGGLLGRNHYQKTQTLVLQDSWAKSKPFLDSENKPLARGSYTVTLNLHGETKPLAVRAYFLGAPNDSAFANALKEYHRTQEQNSTLERAELKQLMSTLESQLANANRVFHEALKKSTSSKGHVEIASDSEWMQLQNQIANSLRKYSPERLDQETYHFELFEEFKTAETKIRELQKIQQIFLLNHGPEKELILIFNQESTLQSELIRLQGLTQRADIRVEE